MSKRDELEVVVPLRFAAPAQSILIDFVKWFAENSALICSLYEDESDLTEEVVLELMPDARSIEGTH